jgi:membrane protein implicated in regulation of membrane protease activity
MRTFRRFVLLQIPDAVLAVLVLWGLHRWAGVSAELAGGLLALWLVAHLAWYPFVKSGYAVEPSLHVGPERLVGARGVATEDLDPVGYVRLESELWSAELGSGEPPVAKGEPVRVLAVRDLTLIVAAHPTGEPR